MKPRSPKPRAFVIFADLDKTFTPMDLKGKEDFVKIVHEITEQCHLQVKFVPVSGRPGGYVLRTLHETRDMLDAEGLPNVCSYGAAEQGAVIVDASRSYAARYMGHKENRGLKATIAQILANNEHRAIICDEPDKLYTCSIHIKNEAKAHMSEAEQMAVYRSVRDDVWAQFGRDTLVIPLAHNCMEVMHKEVSKSAALECILSSYRASFDIVGVCMCGDAENDAVAIRHVSRMAEVPGVPAHVLTPANAQEAISSASLEAWKEANPAASHHRILKSSEALFRGITQLLRKELAQGTLVGDGLRRWDRSFDEHDLPSPAHARHTTTESQAVPSPA